MVNTCRSTCVLTNDRMNIDDDGAATSCSSEEDMDVLGLYMRCEREYHSKVKHKN